MDDNLSRALVASKESKDAEFKQSFDVDSPCAWCEVIKDVIAMANSGGGVILFGVLNNGRASGLDVMKVVGLDPADITNKVNKYTNYDFSEFEISAHLKESHQIAALVVHGVPVPIVFTKPGTYDAGGGKQKTAFSAGQVYFRHGAKSEPGNNNDLRNAIEREVRQRRREWTQGIRRVFSAPRGSVVSTKPSLASTSLTAIRVVNDPTAPRVVLREEDMLAQYPFDYRSLSKAARDRYSDFVENQEYHEHRRIYESDPSCCRTRLLNPLSARSARTRLYSALMLEKLDAHYTLKTSR